MRKKHGRGASWILALQDRALHLGREGNENGATQKNFLWLLCYQLGDTYINTILIIYDIVYFLFYAFIVLYDVHHICWEHGSVVN